MHEEREANAALEARGATDARWESVPRSMKLWKSLGDARMERPLEQWFSNHGS